jgi:hypothetical protein
MKSAEEVGMTYEVGAELKVKVKNFKPKVKITIVR